MDSLLCAFYRMLCGKRSWWSSPGMNVHDTIFPWRFSNFVSQNYIRAVAPAKPIPKWEKANHKLEGTTAVLASRPTSNSMWLICQVMAGYWRSKTSQPYWTAWPEVSSGSGPNASPRALSVRAEEGLWYRGCNLRVLIVLRDLVPWCFVAQSPSLSLHASHITVSFGFEALTGKNSTSHVLVVHRCLWTDGQRSTGPSCAVIHHQSVRYLVLSRDNKQRSAVQLCLHWVSAQY